MDPRSELRQYYDVLRRHVAIIGLVVALAVGGVGLQLFTQARKYQADVSVLVTPQALAVAGDSSGNLAAVQSQYRDLVTSDILYLATSSEVIHRVAQVVPGVREGALYKAVTARALGGTDIIVVSARDTQPDRAELIATTVVQQLVQYYAELNQAAAAGTRKFIGEQVALTKQKLQAAEDSLGAFQSHTNVAYLPDSTSRMIQRTLDLQTAYNGALLDEKAAQVREAALRDRLRAENDAPLASVEIGTNPVVADLRNRLVTAEADLENLRQVYTDKHPKVQQELGTIAALRADLQRESTKALADRSIGVSPIREQMVSQLVGAQVDATVARARADAITPLLGELQAGLGQLPANEVTFGRLQRDVKVNEDLFMRLSSMYQDSIIAEQRAAYSGQAALVMVDQGGAGPVSQKLPLKAGLAGLLGLVMGSVLALLVDNLDSRVKTPRQAEGAYGVPVLASIPTMTSPNQRSVMGQPAAVVGLVLPFVIPFLFVMMGGLVAGVLVSRASSMAGSVASHAGVAYSHAATTVMQMLYHVLPHVG
jgi:uncharacterized protein involved in exopolysaccharide biosynthesis